MQMIRGNSTELATIHPTWGDFDIDDVHALIENDARMSPHVGNLDKITDELPQESLPPFVGAHHISRPAVRTRNNVTLALMGIKIECADTTALNDESTRPYVVLKEERETPITDMSATEREAHVPAAVRACDTDKSIEGIHMDALRAITDKAITRTAFYDGLGVKHGYSKGEVYHSLTTSFDGLVRVAQGGKISNDPKKRVHTDKIDKYGIFGSGNNPLSGIMPPVELAVAAELVEAAIEDRDVLYHMGGMDMERYTQRQDFMHKALTVAERALAGVGVRAPKRLMYTIVNKYHGVAGLTELSQQIGSLIGLERYSQHDLHTNPVRLKQALSLTT
jgi:hypothetical protein